MTMNLYWQPVHTDAEDLDDKLKFILRERYGLGSSVDVRLNASDTAYLQGLRDAGVKDAQKLLDAIKKHGEIRVFEQ